ncbi:MAG: matrixin family metalloprotease [Cyanobacteria bacterium SIG26]|nr:matrixin family metalloprotease [Cyanobacteria bacterium SIG26]
MRKFLLFILLIVLAISLIYKSPFSALYNYNKAKALYDDAQYEKALPYFERSLFADSKGILARFFYVLTLSKVKPTYTVQKKLYQMTTSKINDEATKMAKAQALNLKYKLLDGVDNNFIYNAAMGNDILRWDLNSFPLKIYIENSSGIPDYYYSEINWALKQWESHTNFVKFTQTNNESDANIIIKFKDIPSDSCNGNICRYVAAYTEPDIDTNKILKKMVLSFYKTTPFGKTFSRTEIANTALHEIGHTLGIMGHSDNPTDIMYASKDSPTTSFLSGYSRELSMRDLKTLALLYRIKPTISNKKNLHSEQFYYAPLILGSDDVRLQKKLQEFKDYIQKYPTIAAGYINLSSVYADLGDFKSALMYLDQAQNLSTTNEQDYIINYNKAIIYYNLQEYNIALDFAIKTKSIKNSQNIDNLINEIKLMNTN